MIHSRLVTIYLSLDKQERQLLNKWVSSPITNVHVDAKKLFAFLSSRRKISVDTVKKTVAFEYIYKKTRTYDDLRLRHVMSNCLQAIESFLAYSYLTKDKTQQGIALIKSLQEHQLSEYADSVLQKIKKQRPIKHDISHYFETRQIEIERYNLTDKKNRDAYNNQAIIDITQQLFAADILKQACIAYNNLFTNKNSSYSCTFLPFIIESIENQQIPLIPSIKIYYYAYKDLTVKYNDNEDLDYLKKFLDALYKYETYFNKDELFYMFGMCINQHLVRINTTSKLTFNLSIGEPLYKLLKHGFKKGYLIKYNEIDRFRFNVFVQAGINIGYYKGDETYYDEVKNFISEFARYIHKDYREDTISYAKARLYYVQKDYKNAMLYLSSIELKDSLWNMNAKFMLIKIFFETNQYIPLNSLLNTYAVYISRKKNTPDHLRNIYNKNLVYSKKLYSVMTDPSKKKKESLRRQIESDNDLMNKVWFLEQLN